MELDVTNYDEAIAGWCKTILEAHKGLAFLTEDFSLQSVYEKRTTIDRNLIKMAVSSQRIIDLVFPIPNSGEIHGLPREATLLGDEPDIIVVDRDHPEWDFMPWFSEKSGALKTAINDLMEILESPSSLVSTESDVGQRVKSAMAGIEHKANAILEMIESGRLVIKDVKIDDWEE